MLRDSGAVRELLSHDEALTPEAVVDAIVEGLVDSRSLVLPHPKVGQSDAARAADTGRWLAGMRQLRARTLGSSPARFPA
jgi:hypothetical protein